MSVRQRLTRFAGYGDAPPPRRERLAYHAIRVAILLSLAIATYALFPASPAVESPIFEVGAVATEDVIAPFAFKVHKSPAELEREREELARSAKPILVYRHVGLDSAQRQLDTFMDSIAAAVPEGNTSREAAAAAVQRAGESLGVSLSTPEASYLTFVGRRRVLHNGIRRVYDRWLSAGVAPSGAINDLRGEVTVRRGSAERSVLADSVLTFESMLAGARRMHPDPSSPIGDALFVKLLSAFFHPTIVPDGAAT